MGTLRICVGVNRNGSSVDILNFVVDTTGDLEGVEADYTLCGEKAVHLMGEDIAEAIRAYSYKEGRFKFYETYNALEALVRVASKSSASKHMIFDHLLDLMSDKSEEEFGESFDDDVSFTAIMGWLKEAHSWMWETFKETFIENCVISLLKEVSSGDHSV